MSNPLSTIMAGESVEATLLDGTKLAVFARQMPARVLLSGYMANLLIGDEGKLLDSCCKAPVGCAPLPEGWVDALTDESHLAIVDKLKQLNFTRAVSQTKRLAATAQELQPLESELKPLPTSSRMQP